MKKVICLTVFLAIPLYTLLFADQLGENLRSKGFHVAILSGEDKINLQLNRLEQAIRQQWVTEIAQMLSSNYKESEPTISKAILKEELEKTFSSLSQARQFATQRNTETGWSVTSSNDFYISYPKIRVEGNKATVECEIGFSSAGQNFKGIKESLSFVLENQNWLLSRSENLFGFLKKASEALAQEIGTINLSSEVLNRTKDDFTSTQHS